MHNHYRSVPIGISLILLLCNTMQAQISDNRSSYTVQSGDTLKEIARKLGDADFWQAIYRANADIITAAGFKEGQVLTLPPSVTRSRAFVYANSNTRTAITDTSSETSDPQQLAKFRSAFNRLMNQKKKGRKQAKSQVKQDPTLELGGFILDQTRSKLGRDFYQLFYQQWRPPQNASNYTITITEQPSFGLGTIIEIMINYEKIFRSRLQPRYEYIKAMSRKAVVRCQLIVQKQASVKKHLMGY